MTHPIKCYQQDDPIDDYLDAQSDPHIDEDEDEDDNLINKYLKPKVLRSENRYLKKLEANE